VYSRVAGLLLYHKKPIAGEKARWFHSRRLKDTSHGEGLYFIWDIMQSILAVCGRRTK